MTWRRIAPWVILITLLLAIFIDLPRKTFGLSWLPSNVLGRELKTPFPRMTAAKARETYGTDKPPTQGFTWITDYTFLIRAIDELGRAGKPETLRVGVNYYPYFTSVEYEDPQDQQLKDLWMPASDGACGITYEVDHNFLENAHHEDLDEREPPWEP